MGRSAALSGLKVEQCMRNFTPILAASLDQIRERAQVHMQIHEFHKISTTSLEVRDKNLIYTQIEPGQKCSFQNLKLILGPDTAFAAFLISLAAADGPQK
jgi:hypothetical protein